MNLAQFVNALQPADPKALSYSIKEFKVLDSEPRPSELERNLSGNLIASFDFGGATLTLCQGISINYYSLSKGVFKRRPLEHLDYVDNITLSGFVDVENGCFDLVFLASQLEQQGTDNVDLNCYKLKMLIDLMLKKANIENDNIQKILLDAFDDYVFAMPDVDKLVTQESKDRLIDAFVALKMSDVESQLANATYTVSNLQTKNRTDFHQYISGDVKCSFSFHGVHISTEYYLARKYPIHKYQKQQEQLCFNETHFDPYKRIYFENKSGELAIDLEKKELALEKLEGNTALFFKLQSLFALIKRKNSLPCITDIFDEFYDNLLHDDADTD